MKDARTLEEVRASGQSYTLRCKDCEGEQWADLRAMTDKHWAGCQLGHAVRLWECYWCGARGRFEVVQLRLWSKYG